MTLSDRIRGLVAALRRIGQVDNETGLMEDDACAECGGWTERGAFTGTHGGIPACGTDCPGHIARAALAAWDKRGRLREDKRLAEVIAIYTSYYTDDLADALERILFGEAPATREDTAK